MPDDKLFSKIMKDTLKLEGGINRKETGGGGISNSGITQTTYDSYNKQRNLPTKPVTEVTPQERDTFYNDEFYTRPKINLLPDKIQQGVYDYGVQSSPKRAIQAIQTIVGATPDGIIGPQTTGSIDNYINQYGVEALNQALLEQRKQYIQGLIQSDPKFGDIGEGLQNRLERLETMRQ